MRKHEKGRKFREKKCTRRIKKMREEVTENIENDKTCINMCDF